MDGLHKKRIIWTVVFLGTTLAAVIMELVAGLWHPTGWTIPWTEYLARYVPWPIQLAAYVILAVWLPFHFWRHDRLRSVSWHRGFDEGHTAARARYIPKIHDANRTGYADGWHDATDGKAHRDGG